MLAVPLDISAPFQVGPLQSQPITTSAPFNSRILCTSLLAVIVHTSHNFHTEIAKDVLYSIYLIIFYLFFPTLFGMQKCMIFKHLPYLVLCYDTRSTRMSFKNFSYFIFCSRVAITFVRVRLEQEEYG